jgi:2-dehydropantoate 2-reductase
MSLNIGIIGVGGVGGYYGGKLCRLIATQETKVYFVARGQHLDEIRSNGLSVRTAKEGDWISWPVLATDNFADLPVLDACLICVKEYDLQNATRQLRPHVSEATAIVPLLNGIDIFERMRNELDVGLIFPACTYIGVHISTPGKIYQMGGDCRVLLGPDPQAPAFRPHLLLKLFDQSGIQYEWFEDIYPVLWRKYIFISAFSLVMAGFDKTLGQVMETPKLGEIVRAIMGEVAALAGSKGVALPGDIVDATYRHGNDFAYESKTSFQRDFANSDKPDERDIFCGAILRMGKQSGIATPATRELSDLMDQRKSLSRRWMSKPK